MTYRIAFFTKHKKRTLYAHYIAWAMRRLGHEVLIVNPYQPRRILRSEALASRYLDWRVRRFRPDAVFIFSSDVFHGVLDRLRQTFPTAVILDDFFQLDQPNVEVFKKVDILFHTQKGQLADYEAAGVQRAVYVPSGVDPDYHRPVSLNPAFISDVAFIGKCHVEGVRLDLINRLRPELDLAIYGADWQRFGIPPKRDEVGVPEFRAICASAKIVLGIDKTHELELYFSNRTWFVLGCRGFLLTRYVKGLEQIFANHRHLVWFHDPDEALELARFYLQHDRARERIARCGHEFVHTHYPNERMAESLLAVLLEGGQVPPLTDPGPSLQDPQASLLVDTESSGG